MNENKQDSTAQQPPAKSYKLHALVFLGAVALFIILGWTLPQALNMRESVVERYLMGGFAVFLAGFLFWLK